MGNGSPSKGTGRTRWIATGARAAHLVDDYADAFAAAREFAVDSDDLPDVGEILEGLSNATSAISAPITLESIAAAQRRFAALMRPALFRTSDLDLRCRSYGLDLIHAPAVLGC